MSVKSKEEIAANITADIPDNNAGLISAADIRDNMLDIVNNIIPIVASGDFNSTPFRNGTVRIEIVEGDDSSGKLSVGSGVVFPRGGLQTEAYPGAGSIDHNSLTNLTAGDPHTQYINVTGTRPMLRNFAMGTSWINSSGNLGPVQSTYDNRGFKFEYVDSNNETVYIGSKSTVIFDADDSVIKSAKGVAKAYLNFDGSVEPPVIRSHYNIKELQKEEEGKYTIFFTSGVFADNNYVAIGSSNARSSTGSEEDFETNTVGLVVRSGNDSTALRSVTFAVLNDAGEFVDAEINELVVYGRSPGESSGVYPTVTVLT
jgi:hypothetical protein